MTSSVIRHVGTGWTGERLLDWTGTGQNERVYGENAHHDVVWTAGSTGAVSATLRYDPWGTLTSSTGSSLPDFRFQGSWFDTTTSLAWVITRWYATALGRFVSEDSLLGDPVDPPSRHLYAYGAGEPIARWDPDGRFWYRVKAGDTLSGLALRYLDHSSLSTWIFNRNRRKIADPKWILPGWCIWIPDVPPTARANQCSDGRPITVITDDRAKKAAVALGINLNTYSYAQLLKLTHAKTGRTPVPAFPSLYRLNRDQLNALLVPIVTNFRTVRLDVVAGVTYVDTAFVYLPVPGSRATTVGGFVFLNDPRFVKDNPLTAHEYIHVLYGEALGAKLMAAYGINLLKFDGRDPRHPYESLGYVWEGWIATYGNKALGSAYYGDNQPWCHFKPAVPDSEYCG